MGGEKFYSPSSVSSRVGSPPRGRGKGWEYRHFNPDDGITPAWAGKRTEYPLTRMTDKDHPRVGGEKTKKIP